MKIIKIYPNPTTSGTINIVHNVSGGMIVLRDSSGRELLRQTITSKHETISLDNFTGVCVINIEGANNISKAEKVLFS